MFTSELANIYSQKPYLNDIIPFHEVSPQIEQFLNQEVRLGARNLNPYRFSYTFAYDPKDVINLFIAFSSKDGPLHRLYRYDCGECEETNILDGNQLKHFKCFNCGSTGDVEKKQFLENVKVVFEIKEPFLKEVKIRLKDQASSKNKETTKKTSLEEALNLSNIVEYVNSYERTLDPDFDALVQDIYNEFSSGLV